MDKPKPHAHFGHRERMREKLSKNTEHTLNNHELIEMLLYYVYPRCNTNEKAHKLLNYFGGDITALMSADKKQLIDAGLTPSAASFFEFYRELNRVCDISRIDDNFRFDDYESLLKYSVNLIDNPKEEQFYIICFDIRGRRICNGRIVAGIMRKVDVSMRSLMEVAVKNDAASVVLVHNHPNGITSASWEDIAATQYVDEIFSKVNITLADHIIVADGKAISMRESGHFDVKIQADDNK